MTFVEIYVGAWISIFTRPDMVHIFLKNRRSVFKKMIEKVESSMTKIMGES